MHKTTPVVTKLSKTFIPVIILLVMLNAESCKNAENDVIPDVYVSFEMDILNDIEFRDLGTTNNHVIVTAATNNWGPGAAGFSNNGIIVYRSLPDEFNAYDRTCPHDYVRDGTLVRVNVDFTVAICPKCSTVYALSAFGTPVSGPGKYPLKNYKTRFDGQYVTVWNQ